MEKVVVITGASSGIGLETAQLLGEKGYKVYGVSRTKVENPFFFSVQGDVTNPEDISKIFQKIYDQEKRIDVLINNAGMGISGSIEHTELKDAKYIFDVNFLGSYICIQNVLPYLRETKGKIINVGSVAGKLAIPFQSFYSASKAAIQTFSESLKIEVEPMGIDVCVVLPGDIKTGFTKNRRKNQFEGKIYQTRVEKSIAVMEKDEQNGMPARIAAKTFYKLIKKKRMPLYKTIGFQYKIFIFLQRLLPTKLVNKLVGMIYGFKKS